MEVCDVLVLERVVLVLERIVLEDGREVELEVVPVRVDVARLIPLLVIVE